MYLCQSKACSIPFIKLEEAVSWELQTDKLLVQMLLIIHRKLQQMYICKMFTCFRTCILFTEKSIVACIIICYGFFVTEERRRLQQQKEEEVRKY